MLATVVAVPSTLILSDAMDDVNDAITGFLGDAPLAAGYVSFTIGYGLSVRRSNRRNQQAECK